MHEMPITVDIFGGNTAHKAALSVINLDNPEANGEIYDNWASSVKDFPQIIEKKVVGVDGTFPFLSVITRVEYSCQDLTLQYRVLASPLD